MMVVSRAMRRGRCFEEFIPQAVLRNTWVGADGTCNHGTFSSMRDATVCFYGNESDALERGHIAQEVAGTII